VSTLGVRRDVLADAHAVARVAATSAPAVDADNRFPEEAIAALREYRLLGLLVPEAQGGMEAGFAVACEVGEILGAACLSTALIWAMHSQQLAIIAAHAAAQWAPALVDIAERGALVASATTEPTKGGALMHARAPLVQVSDGFRLERPSPVVSYGAEAEHHLVTMRADPSSPETDVRYVLLARGDGMVIGGWDALGMRGTRSVAMRFVTDVRPEQVLAEDFRRVALMTAIPAAHLGWTSAWHGCARGALDRVVALLADDPGYRRRLTSDLFVHRLGDVRLSLDLLESMLRRLVSRYEALRAAEAPPAAYEDPRWTIAMNGLKVAGARLSHSAVDVLMTLTGMAQGYLRDAPLGLERAYRDLRSASLMVSDDHLLAVNANHMLMRRDQPPQEDLW
jgi:acyl-CoA dehydrogenase